jgi:hypothetical protein
MWEKMKFKFKNKVIITSGFYKGLIGKVIATRRDLDYTMYVLSHDNSDLLKYSPTLSIPEHHLRKVK